MISEKSGLNLPNHYSLPLQGKPYTGSFILVDETTNATIAAGMIEG
jgi:sulfate adenylyltransferase subunit 1 (EFTu-like GTPase family)